MDTVKRAYELAKKAHEGQFRKGENPAPYISHPAAVVAILKRAGLKSEHLLAVAWLHDVVEDTAVTVEEIAQHFGQDIAADVYALCNQPAADKHKEQLSRMVTASECAQNVKAADKAANLKDILESPPLWPDDKKRSYARDGKELVDAMPLVSAELRLAFNQVYERLEASFRAPG